jgi:hypothetical protein
MRNTKSVWKIGVAQHAEQQSDELLAQSELIEQARSLVATFFLATFFAVVRMSAVRSGNCANADAVN